MSNPNWGLAPVDSGTDVGQLRYVIGDTAYEIVEPPIDQPTWEGDFSWFSDYALEVFLDRTDDDVDLAAIYAWRQMGDILAADAANIKTDDLAVSELWRRAQFFYDRADKAEATVNADIFVLGEIGPRCCSCHCHQELAPVFIVWENCCECRL